MKPVFFTTGFRDGDVRAPGALEHLLRAKRLPVQAATAEQIHGVRVRIVSKLRGSKRFLGMDGLVTEAPDQPLAIFTADCVPIFISADDGNVVGLLHAGWRGVRGKILAKAVRLLRRHWGLKASSIQAWAGPSIGPCCFEVQWDVARYFPFTRRRAGDRWNVDLEKELARQARDLGIGWSRKKPFEGCTMHGRRYYSYRRDKTEKRQVSIMMKVYEVT